MLGQSNLCREQQIPYFATRRSERFMLLDGLEDLEDRRAQARTERDLLTGVECVAGCGGRIRFRFACAVGIASSELVGGDCGELIAAQQVLDVGRHAERLVDTRVTQLIDG